MIVGELATHLQWCNDFSWERKYQHLVTPILKEYSTCGNLYLNILQIKFYISGVASSQNTTVFFERLAEDLKLYLELSCEWNPLAMNKYDFLVSTG